MNNYYIAEGLSPYFIRSFDYRVGDIVQIRPDGKTYSGRVGEIVAIFPPDERKSKIFDLLYVVKLSDKESAFLFHQRIKLVRAVDSDIEENSEFFEKTKILQEKVNDDRSILKSGGKTEG